MMLGIALSTLRHRKAGFVGAFVGLFCAAALVCGCGMLMETGLTGSVTPQRYAGTPIVVSGDQDAHLNVDEGGGRMKKKSKAISDRAWLPASTADLVRSAPGVRTVTTEVDFPAYIPGRPTTESWGHGWESAALTPFTLANGRAPSAPDEIVVDAGTARSLNLTVGSAIPVQTPAGTSRYRVTGVTREGLDHQTATFFSTAEARRLAGHPGQVAMIGVSPAGAAPAVKDALRGTSAKVHTGDGRGRIEFLAADNGMVKLTSMGAAMGGTALLVAILVVVGTFALSIQQRQREIALMRAVAATPKQIRKMIGAEALTIGLVAGPLGAAAGLAVGYWLHAELVDHGAIPANLKLVIGPFAPLAAVASTLLAGWTAARVSARRIARIRPVEALGDAALQPPRMHWFRVLLGLVAVGGGVVMTMVLSTVTTDKGAGPLTPVTALVWTIAVALLGPLLARVAFGLFGLVLRVSGATGFVAGANLRTGARRLASVITPLSLMVAISCTLIFAESTLDHAASSQARAGTLAAYTIGPKAPVSAAAAIRAVPGVRAVTEVLHTQVRSQLSSFSAQGVTPEGLTDTMDLGILSGSLDGLNDATMAARAGIGIHLGDEVPVVLADGTAVTLRVIATYDRGLGFGDLTLAHDLVAAHVDVPFDDSVLVSAPSRVRPALVTAIRSFPGLGVLDRRVVAAKQQQSGTPANYISLGLIVAFAAISVINTLTMATLGRFRELALLRLVGATRRQVMRMLGWETLIVVLVATAIGTAISWVTLTALSTGMTGTSRPYAPPAIYLGVVAGTGLLALLATVLPARLALSRKPAEAVGVGG